MVFCFVFLEALIVGPSEVVGRVQHSLGFRNVGDYEVGLMQRMCKHPKCDREERVLPVFQAAGQ